MWLLRSSQPLERRDFLLFYCTEWCYAGPPRLAIDQDGAGSALGEAAAKLGSAQLQFVAQYIKQRSFWVDVNRVNVAVYFERNSSHHLLPNIASQNLTNKVESGLYRLDAGEVHNGCKFTFRIE